MIEFVARWSLVDCSPLFTAITKHQAHTHIYIYICSPSTRPHSTAKPKHARKILFDDITYYELKFWLGLNFTCMLKSCPRLFHFHDNFLCQIPLSYHVEKCGVRENQGAVYTCFNWYSSDNRAGFQAGYSFMKSQNEDDLSVWP